MPLSEGEVVGQYQIVSQLGQGGMATVYKAYHAKLDRYVAIKVLHPAFQEDPNFLTRFEREAQIVAKLEHPNIVPVYDYSEHQGQPYLVMKFLQGRTLKNILREKPLPLAEIVRLMSAVGSALTYAHDMGVLHRDIKPSNIILDQHNMPYLADFGLARMVQSGESTMSQDVIIGTPNYISPEQARGDKALSRHTDIYSLGVVLYELVVGRVPFSADTPYAVIHDHIYTALPKPSAVNPDVPPQVEKVLLKALAKNPADRYDSANAMVEDFKQAVASSGLKELDPERANSATAMLAKLREQQGIAHEESPVIPAPRPQPTNPPERKRKQQVEASFDFSNLGQQVEQWGQDFEEAVDNAFEDNPTTDLRFFAPGESGIRRRVEKQMKKRGEFFGHLAAYVVVNIILWVIFGASWVDGEGADFPWPLIVGLGWGSGLAAHAVSVFYETGNRLARRVRAVQNAAIREFGDDWDQVIDKKSFKEIRRKAEQPFKKREEFLSHAAVYVFIITMLWVIFGLRWVVGEGADFPWPLIPMLGWGFGLGAHGVEAFSASNREKRLDAAVAREIEKERQRGYGLEKPKRESQERGVRLNSEGELTDSFVDELHENPKRQTHSRR
jgi:serine/threonine protein kinase